MKTHIEAVKRFLVSIDSTMESVVREYELAQEKLIAANQQIREKSLIIAELEASARATRDDLAREVANVNEEKSRLEDLRQRTQREYVDLSAVKTQLEGDINKLKLILSSLEKQVKGLEVLKKTKDILSNEVDSLRKEVNDLIRDSKATKDAARDAKEEYERLREKCDKEVKKVDKEIEERWKTFEKTVANLKERETIIKQKESDLAVYEQRIKEKYREIGRDFKI